MNYIKLIILFNFLIFTNNSYFFLFINMYIIHTHRDDEKLPEIFVADKFFIFNELRDSRL